MDSTTRGEPVARLIGTMVDCADPGRLAAFWAEVLGLEETDRLGDPPQFVYLSAPQPDAPRLFFQRVPEPKVVKNRVHLDVFTDDLETASARIEALGGRRRDDHDFHDEEHDEHWRRMADPEGNEFCLVFDLRAPSA